jgi:hypothetical protein
MQCTNCGKIVPDTAKVCGYCGHRLKEDTIAAATPNPVPVPPAQPRKKASGWKWAAIVVMAILVVIAIGSAKAIARRFAAATPPVPVAVATRPTATRPTIVPVNPMDDQEVGSDIPPTPEPVLPENKIIVEPTDKADTTSLGTETGDKIWSVNIASTTPAKMTWGWCATTQATLDQNLKNMQVAFFVDDLDVTNSVGQSTVEAKDAQTSTIYYCHNYHGVIRSWTAGKHTIIYKMVFLQKINDGWEDAEGTRTRTYNVNVTP